MVKLSGFAFLKFDCQIKEKISGEVSISNNVAIKDVKEDGDQLEVLFTFGTRYGQPEKEMATFVFDGKVNLVDDKNILDIYKEEWNKNKKLPAEVMTRVLNIVLTRSNIEAIKLSQVFMLPPPIPLPEVKQ